ncbi:phosphatidylglycerophosphatase A [Pontibacillus yanchengensis]|uniref:Phosphatidylglycerophosphatase A n=2 Tax=Pontibacillus yanchengensis TaxID=462910 RepID=A0ACC7VCS9_9BACI|nr:phosphatidylglycerophosphatase A [Pontibacillus yanchengensis]MYL32198.1 phosphatidylglycerophosphatase A [Pontibacillus yanchengensis]MYL52778.1 phosphatidylglycerophosphatase A [Pontibacillus yanchengensis]
MAQTSNQVHSREVERAARELLQERGATVQGIAEIVYEMQAQYTDTLTMDDCYESVDRVLEKREIQHAVLVGIELDKLAENNQLSQPLQQIVESDEGLFGVDETIALGAVFGYGSIAVTTYGHLDKQKIGLIKELDTKEVKGVHTFLDDIIASIAANASGRIAHRLRDYEEELEEDEIKIRDEEDRLS